MSDMFKPVGTSLPVKQGFWSKFKSFWLQDADEFLAQEIRVELTPKQQKVEDEINEFLHQEVTWQKIRDFLFQEITIGKKNQDPQQEVTSEQE